MQIINTIWKSAINNFCFFDSIFWNLIPTRQQTTKTDLNSIGFFPLNMNMIETGFCKGELNIWETIQILWKMVLHIILKILIIFYKFFLLMIMVRITRVNISCIYISILCIDPRGILLTSILLRKGLSNM